MPDISSLAQLSVFSLMFKHQVSFIVSVPVDPPKRIKLGLQKASACPYRGPGRSPIVLTSVQIALVPSTFKWNSCSLAIDPPTKAPPNIISSFSSIWQVEWAALWQGTVPVSGYFTIESFPQKSFEINDKCIVGCDERVLGIFNGTSEDQDATVSDVTRGVAKATECLRL